MLKKIIQFLKNVKISFCCHSKCTMNDEIKIEDYIINGKTDQRDAF
jgi:hypothetical protein